LLFESSKCDAHRKYRITIESSLDLNGISLCHIISTAHFRHLAVEAVHCADTSATTVILPSEVGELAQSPDMPLQDLYRVVKDASRDQRNALQANRSKLAHRLLDVFLRTWDLGLTGFGGPPVHFKIIRDRFVEGKGGKTPWIDEQTVSCI
jgi:hypothetical protein